MSTTTPQPPIETEAPTADARRTPAELFEFSSWVHVGEGAEECEQRFTGRCDHDQHFHAWVRLPNPYQVRDINEKAKAAQARRLRMLRNEDSDAFVILEAELDDLRDAANSGALDALVLEIVDQDHAADLTRATRIVMDMDDPSWEPKEGDEDITPPKLYATIDQDFEEFRRQVALPEDERAEDFDELQRTITSYTESVNEEMFGLRSPKIENLKAQPLEVLIDMVRKLRRESDASEAYLHTYHSWVTFACTFKPKDKGVPNVLYFNDFERMKRDTSETVLVALRETFDRLNRARMTAGNS